MEQGDKRKDCCKLEENLGPVVKVAEDLTFRRCLVCNCRHFEAVLDPLKMNLTGAQLG